MSTQGHIRSNRYTLRGAFRAILAYSEVHLRSPRASRDQRPQTAISTQPLPRTLPACCKASFSATRWLPVNRVERGSACLSTSPMVLPGPARKSTSALGMPQWCSKRSSCSATMHTWTYMASIGSDGRKMPARSVLWVRTAQTRRLGQWPVLGCGLVSNWWLRVCYVGIGLHRSFKPQLLLVLLCRGVQGQLSRFTHWVKPPGFLCFAYASGLGPGCRPGRL